MTAAPPIVRRHTRDLEWRAQNPLRAWRERTGTRAVTVARRLDVSKFSVMYWERGDRQPKAATMRHLAQVTGISDIDRRWLRWLADRPGDDDPSLSAGSDG